ncbi:hypothetical protein [Phytohabitans houttuyneae]|uniref:Uncharacterized protein n=1 Tax=Phytohabitans houttuyneae TaxID=1076126 RepID=A0A6V8K2Q2_9ACTN|nr:hypothetical protein [Phytohabitans houttuyneae]GFJ79422.1 hypothetical protein Phou_036020 [Phytohabitans houttuyneae]
MSTEGADEVTITVPWWRVRQSPDTVLRAARDTARRKKIAAEGDPIVRVTLVWPGSHSTEAAA